MKKHLMIAASLLALSASAQAGQTDYGVGKTAASWLNLPSGARSAALAGTGVCMAASLESVAVNPAANATLKGQNLSVMHNAWLGTASLEQAAWGMGLGEGSGVSLGYRYLNYGDIDRYSIVGGAPVQDGVVKSSASAIDLGYASHVRGRLALGANVRYISETLDAVDASSYSADLGAGIGLSNNLGVGISVQDLGSKLNNADLPTRINAGATWGIKTDEANADVLTLSFALQVFVADSSATTASVAGEYSLGGGVFFRGGYKAADRGSLSGLNGVTAGLGVKLSVAQLDYAFVPMGDLGTGHLVSLAASF